MLDKGEVLMPQSSIGNTRGDCDAAGKERASSLLMMLLACEDGAKLLCSDVRGVAARDADVWACITVLACMM